MSILKLKPSCKDYLWGGQRLRDEFGVESESDIIAEAWILACHPDGQSFVENGKTLAEYIEEKGQGILGTNCQRFNHFPILIKLIDAKNNLSIQVHPSDDYALKNEGQYGKTEVWYVMRADEGSFLYYGFNREVSKEEFARRIKDNTLLEVLNAVPVKKGDTFIIEPGTLHAIGKGILLAEVQQNSNVTYRIYDYGRIGKDGKPRELHIEKALDVTERRVPNPPAAYPHIAANEYFTVDKISLDGKFLNRAEGVVSEESFLSVLILEGTGVITSSGKIMPVKKGDSLFLTANSGHWSIEGKCDALLTRVC